MLYYINDRIGVLELCTFSCGLGMCYKWGDKQKYLNASSLKNVLATFLQKIHSTHACLVYPLCVKRVKKYYNCFRRDK